MSRGIEPLTVLVDTREQTPWDFSPSVAPLRATLHSGDYSLPGLSDWVAIERKSLPDLLKSIASERDRFFRELERLSDFGYAAVIVEANAEAVHRGQFGQSKLTVNQVLGTCATIHADYGVPVLFAGPRPCASFYAEKLLRRWWNMKNKGRAGDAGQPAFPDLEP